MKIGVCFIENRSLLFENQSLFFDNRSLFFENRSLLFWKSELVFLKIGVCFFENRSLFFENRGLFLWKSEFVFLKIGVWFFENRSLFFWKPEFVVLKMGVCFFENGSLFFRKSWFDFWKSSLFFMKIQVLAPDSALCFCSWVGTKSVADPGEGPGGPAPPPLIFRPNWGLRPTDRPPPPYLKVWKIYLSLQNFVYVLVKYLMINQALNSLFARVFWPGCQPSWLKFLGT